MKKILTLLLAAFLLQGCARNAITGRNQLSLVSDDDLQALALVQYNQFLTTNTVVPSGSTSAEMVKRVGNRIAVAVKQYYAKNGFPNALDNYKWEFNLVENKEINAWCMPGGKVVVYTGILPVTQTEAGLAIVLAHEITHAVVGHSKERVSQQLVAEGLGSLGGAALGNNSKAGAIFNATYGLGAQYGVLLPNSRNQELEADHYGLIFAAAAGYDPRAAVEFWTRMSAISNGNKPPEFLSSHPSDEKRISQIQKLMPEALKYYHIK